MDLNANALVSLADLKSFLGITDTTKDFTLTMYINGISDYIQGNGGTVLAKDYTEKYQGNGTQNLILKHRLINSVATLKSFDTEITGYEILSGPGMLYRDGGWGISGSSAPMMSDRVNWPSKSIEITYNAGYATVPSDLLMLVMALIKNQYEYDTKIESGLKSYSIGDVQMSWGDASKVLSSNQNSILNKYLGFRI